MGVDAAKAAGMGWVRVPQPHKDGSGNWLLSEVMRVQVENVQEEIPHTGLGIPAAVCVDPVRFQEQMFNYKTVEQRWQTILCVRSNC